MARRVAVRFAGRVDPQIRGAIEARRQLPAREQPEAWLQIARDPSRDRAHTALADFIAPKESGLADYIGGFAVTTGLGEEEALASRLDKTDDYLRR